MALRLVVNNDERTIYLGRFLRAVMWTADMGGMPDDRAGLLLQLDEQAVEDNFRDMILRHDR